jgi:NTP pyrophosphatase (non-canonical NTP hydrolase)
MSDLNDYSALCHEAARSWWQNPMTGERIERNDGELIALMHSELSEALEAVRKGLQDSHLPHRRGVEVELADLMIRVFDYAGARGLDLEGAVREKLAFNARREDHTHAARLAANGKKF